jgi:hypothetical protein
VLVDQPVRRDGAAAGGVALAAERRDAPACFLDDGEERGDVPQAHERVDCGLQRAFRDQHVLPEIAEGPRLPEAFVETIE